jgi:hypothetical protein
LDLITGDRLAEVAACGYEPMSWPVPAPHLIDEDVIVPMA